MNIWRISVVSVGLAALAAASCKGADPACYEQWTSDSTGAQWLARCSCGDWSGWADGRPTSDALHEYRQVDGCSAGVVATEGAHPENHPPSNMICCARDDEAEVCTCEPLEGGYNRCEDEARSARCTPEGVSGTAGSGHCTSEEPHTTYASCATDGDCWSGYCNDTDGKAPYCFPPNDGIRAEGRGYDCETDADCEAVAPDFVARGGTASCYRMTSVSVHKVCTFNCNAP